MTVKSKYWGWHLYWVHSDGLEDCFVVARNIRSAIKIERDMNGFDLDEVGAIHVCKIPEKTAKSELSKKSKDLKHWPWYGYKSLLIRLGAEFREINGRTEYLIDGVVYSEGEPPRIIGRKFIKEFLASEISTYFDDESTFTKSQETIYTLLGLCIARCQEIEHYISQSFIFIVNCKEKPKYKTINDMVAGWKKKTFGQLIKLIEESYTLEDQFKEALTLFLSWRNRLVHGLTVQPEYDISSIWGQDETMAFLTRFEFISRAVKIAFRSAYWASIEFANIKLINEQQKTIRLDKKQKEELSMFPYFFILHTVE